MLDHLVFVMITMCLMLFTGSFYLYTWASCSKQGYANPGLVSIFNSLLIHNNVDSSKLFSINNLTLFAFKLSR